MEIKTYSQDDISKMLRRRGSEAKLGEHMQFADTDWKKDLNKSNSPYVLLGIPEDVGVKANFGRPGASTAVRPAFESFMNQQSNFFLDGSEIFLLGELDVEKEMEAAGPLDPRKKEDLQQLRDLVSLIDEKLQNVIFEIVLAGKIPLVVGGGHNNSYGNIKGSSRALKKKIDVINCDPHLDFRPAEGRHSGNGFSYAYDEGFLDRYSVFGVHEQYNSTHSLTRFKETPQQLYYRSFESIFVRQELEFTEANKQCIGFVKNEKTGLELDLDAITNVPSSAKTSSGLTPLQARQFVHRCAKELDLIYFHVAEGAPVLSHIKADNKTGKLIAYLLSDFIKAHKARTF